MIKSKEIIVDNYNFIITYPTGEDNLKFYLDKQSGAVTFTFKPSIFMTTEQAETILKDYYYQLKNHLLEIVSEYSNFYNYFEFENIPLRSGYMAGYNDVSQVGAISASQTLGFNLKKEYLQK